MSLNLVIPELTISPSKLNDIKQTEKLLLVNVFNRHGDRSPVGDQLPKNDRHGEKIEHFWPNGLDTLTECGEQRMYRLGLSLRNQYRNFLSYDTSSIMALSSSSPRCVKSQQETLRGLMELTSSKRRGEDLVKLRETKRISTGLGQSCAWKDIMQYTDLIPLEWGCYKRSAYHKNHPSRLKDDLCAEENIAKLPGIQRLKEILETRYEQKFNTDAFDIWTAIECELYLDRTKETISFIDHFADWIQESIEENCDINLYDLFEVVTQIGFIRRVDKNGQLLLTSPLIKSLIESQSVVIDSEALLHSSELAGKYLGKEMILYSTHDFILTTMLNQLGIHQIGDSSKFVERLEEAKKFGYNDAQKYLSGLMMAHFGLSLKFELYMVELSNNFQLPIVRLAIYNEDSPNKLNIEWEPIALGQIMQKRYAVLYPDRQDVRKFYSTELGFKINLKYDCPFALFNEVAKTCILTDEEYMSIYEDNNKGKDAGSY